MVVWPALASHWFLSFCVGHPVHPVEHGRCLCLGLDWSFFFRSLLASGEDMSLGRLS